MTPTPLCPILLAAAQSGALATEHGLRQLQSGGHLDYGACMGSLCVRWEPETFVDRGADLLPNGGYPLALTGRGWCSDNLRGAPYPDPSAPVKS